jgi:hypothetical protein
VRISKQTLGVVAALCALGLGSPLIACSDDSPAPSPDGGTGGEGPGAGGKPNTGGTAAGGKAGSGGISTGGRGGSGGGDGGAVTGGRGGSGGATGGTGGKRPKDGGPDVEVPDTGPPVEGGCRNCADIGPADSGPKGDAAGDH